MTTRREQAGAVLFSVLMVVSMIGGTVAFGGVAAADGSTGIDIGDEDVGDEGLLNTENGTESTATNDSDSGDSQESSSTDGGEFGQIDTTSGGDTGDRSSISPRVRIRLDQSSPSERIPVILLFRTQPEDQLPLDRLSAAEARDDIQTLAEESQGPTLRYLDEQAQRGKVADVQSLYLRNAIAVEANPEVIEELASARAIERVILDEQVSVLDDSNSGDGLDGFLSELNETSNGTVDPTGFERVVDSEPARGVEEIQADSVQDAGVTGDGVNVSVIDTGINDSHPALEGQVVLRENFVNNETNVGDPQGHGTHVAGTIAGRTDAQQAVGVAPDANLFDARALNGTGSGQLSDIISAFEWSAENDADVASASIGLDPYGDDQEEHIQIDNESTGNVTFEVYSNATNSIGENASGLDGFRPAYVYVGLNNATISNISSTVNEEAAVENLSLTLRGPDGEQTLEPNEAGFTYPSGTVPDGEILYKYTPSSSQPVPDGNWTLTVSNENGDTGVGVDVETVPVYPPDGTDEVSQAVNNLESTGTIPVIAAGNAGVLGNRTLASPAAAENAITVGASQPESIDVAPFSGRGPVDFGADTRPGVDLIAPGVDIVSAGSPQAEPGEEPYLSATGTSMATPHVSGTVALLLDADPTLDRSGVETALESTAQAPPAGENAVGAGALDAYAAVDSVTDEPLTANQSVDSGIELYAGLGNTSETDVSASAQPETDPVGDAGSAPDIEAAAAEVYDDAYEAEFQIGLANNTTASVTSFTTYIDADQNSSTGDDTQAGAEYRLNVSRTYDGETHGGSVDAFRFNDTSEEYELADLPADVDDWAFEYSPQYVQYTVETDSGGIDTTEFDWHVVSRNPNSTGSDRFPDTGQADTEYDVTVDGIGVAWNSSAGQPATDSPLQFRLYNESGVLVGNRTVRTDGDGVARTTFQVVSEVYSDYTLEIESERGDAVRQEYSLNPPSIDRGPDTEPEPTDKSEYTVVNRDYDIRPDDQVEVNIPVYAVDNGSIDPYEGPASIRFTDGPNINDTAVTDGTLTHTVNYTDLFDDETAYGTSYRIALTANYTEANETYYAGYINVESDVELRSSVAPETQVTPPQTETSVSFQTIAERDGTGGQYSSQTPSDVNSTYEVTWITDRVVASFYNELPDSTAISLAEARRTGEQADALTDADRRAIDAAIENVSTQGVVLRTVTGEVAPETRGIGQFDVTPPEDTRLGLVTVTPNASEVDNETATASSGESEVFVDQRVDEYLRTPTAPEKEDQYVIDVQGHWDSHENEDGVVVPNESIEVDVEIWDQIDDEPVSDTDVVLYTTGGDTVTVTTDSEGRASTTIPAPDLDYQNVGYDFTTQQILGIARGLQTSTGRAVSDTDTVYGDAYVTDDQQETDGTESNTGVLTDPSLSYNETTDRLALDVEYRNGTTYEPTNATTSLTMLSTPDAQYSTQRDVFVGYLGSDTNATVVSEEFDESVPGDQSRQYEVQTRTPNAFDGSDSVFLNGIDTDIDSPGQIEAGEAGNVTVTLTNRTGGPVADASVVLYYTELDSQGTVTAAGDALIGTTNASGAATFTVSPDLADEFDRGFVRFRAGYATDDVANPSAGYGFTSVASDAHITGSIEYRNGTAAANSDIVAVGGDENQIVRETRTDGDGTFDLSVPQGNAYAVAFAQDEPITDGVPDLYTFASTGVLDGNASVGQNTLPAGNETTVQVVDEGDNPVSESIVWITSHGTQSFDSQGVGDGALTNEQGQLNVTGNAVELADNVTVEVYPPEDSTRFVSDLDQYTRQVTVTNDTSVTVTLVEDTDDGSDGGDGGDGGDGDAVFSVSQLGAPVNVTVGETLTVTALVQNDGNAGGTKTVSLGLNGTTVNETNVMLDAGASETVTLTYDPTVDDIGENVSLSVTTPDDSATRTVDVLSPAEIEATITIDQQPVAGGTPAVFNASDSVGQNLTYTWEFETVEGVENTTPQSDPVIEQPYSESGTYDVTLTVTDEFGQIAETTRTVTVESESTEEEVPGFGSLIALVAVLASALLMSRRKD